MTFMKALRRSATWRGMFTPGGFLLRAVLLVAAFGLCHAFGLRRYTAILSGTTGDLSVSFETGALLGMVYVLFYIAATVMAPILAIASGILCVLNKALPCADKRGAGEEPVTPGEAGDNGRRADGI